MGAALDLNSPKSAVLALIYRGLKSAYYSVFRAFLLLRCWWSDFQTTEIRSNLHGVPPALLRYKVSESLNIPLFLDVGKSTASTIERRLRGLGQPLEHMERVLDFGCGCGRTARWLIERYPRTSFFGTDVDEASIRWCQRYIKGAFGVNSSRPPLVFADKFFDCIYAISVFTHLSEADQRAWLLEFRRILRDGGILLLSLHGACSQDCLSAPEADDLRREGILFKRSNKLRGLHPEWYQTSFHDEEYMQQMLDGYFKMVSYNKWGLGYQDLVILEKAAA